MDKSTQELPFWLVQADKLRLNMPEEQSQPWLSFLLDAYALIDASVYSAIEEAKKEGNTLACKKDCSLCCMQSVPISPVEAMGIRFTIQKLLPKIEREQIQAQLKKHNGNKDWQEGQCPFLLEKSCSIYPFRPIACRRHLVLNTPCKTKDELLSETRPQDILIPERAAYYAALAHTSPVYASLGISQEGQVLSFDNFQELFIDIRTIHWA